MTPWFDVEYIPQTCIVKVEAIDALEAARQIAEGNFRNAYDKRVENTIKLNSVSKIGDKNV